MAFLVGHCLLWFQALLAIVCRDIPAPHPLFTHLYLTAVATVALGAATLVAADVIDALAAVLTRIRFAFIILEVAQLAGKT